MTDTVCLVTGCQLEVAGQFFWGDLHEHPTGAWIFNAVLDARGEPRALEPRGPAWPSLRAGPSTWERRGVFLLSSVDSLPNQVLRRRIAEAIRG